MAHAAQVTWSMTKPRYYVRTYDWNAEEYTPQAGVKVGPYSIWGLKRALQRLRSLGYQAHRQDNDVLVEREDFYRMKS